MTEPSNSEFDKSEIEPNVRELGTTAVGLGNQDDQVGQIAISKWWQEFCVPFAFVDKWLSLLEGDVDQVIAQKALKELGQPSTSPAPVNQETRNNRYLLLAENDFYSTIFRAPTRSRIEANQIAALQADRLTAIPAKDAVFALSGPLGAPSVDGESEYRLFVARRKAFVDVRAQALFPTNIEAFLACDNSEKDAVPIVAIFRDEQALKARSARRLATGLLVLALSSNVALLAWSLQTRFERESLDYSIATREASLLNKEAMIQRAQALSHLSDFGQGATLASADRVLVTIADVTARAPLKTRIQAIEISQEKVQIRGFAEDPNSARLAFLQPAGNALDAGIAQPRAPTIPGPMPPISNVQSSPPNSAVGSTSTGSSDQIQSPQWQSFAVELPTSQVKIVTQTEISSALGSRNGSLATNPPSNLESQ